MTLFAYTVQYKGKDETSQAFDITEYVERLEITDVGTGEVRSAILRLNAQDGQFITRANALGTNNNTPIIDVFDMFEIFILDAEQLEFKEVFEANIIKPIQNT